MKQQVTSKGLQIIGIVTMLGVAAVLLIQRFGPLPRQMRNMAAAEQHVQILDPILKQDARFTNVALHPFSGSGGSLFVSGELPSDKDVSDLQKLVAGSKPPVEVVYHLSVIPPEFLQLLKTNSAATTKDSHTTMRLKIQLPTAWVQQDNPDGPATFCRHGSTSSFQVSWAEYRGGKVPDVTADKLKAMAADFGEKQSFGGMLESSTGACRFGMFGRAVFHSLEHPRIQIWFISDGRDHIMATHICNREPESSEVAEVQRIASSLALGPGRTQEPERK